MPTKKGHTNNPNGRKRGIPNKVTTGIKEAYRNLLELNTPNMVLWLERIAENDPAKALDICIKLSEYIIPKLARSESNVTHSVDDKLKQILMDIDGRTSKIPDNAPKNNPEQQVVIRP